VSERLRAAEFFAGIGLMRRGLADAGIETVWANDIESRKRDMYVENFGEEGFLLADVRNVEGDLVPDVEIATASFPCTDLSLAGNRLGLGAAAAAVGTKHDSSMFWEFARVLEEMGERRPGVVLLENVLGFASSHGGRDLIGALQELSRLGYSCDVLAIDARHFVPQSRSRMFILGVAGLEQEEEADDGEGEDDEQDGERDEAAPSFERPAWAGAILERATGVRTHARPLPALPTASGGLDTLVERLPAGASDWWDAERLARFIDSLSPRQAERLERLRAGRRLVWRTAYRRTREGVPMWEVRADGIAGCLRTASGGSSKQALVEVGRGEARVRWMTPREYARLMGADDYKLTAARNQALFGFGDAVCVPVIAWLAEHYLVPAAIESGVLAQVA
jgi:DNA (cytosine-5)-methyltransferase 1